MENAVTLPNAGALPPDPDELNLIHTIETNGLAADPDTDADKPREHVRSPELRRHGTKLTMFAAAVIGAAAGARLLFGDHFSQYEPLMNSIAQTGTFGEVFLRQTLLGALFLAVEFVLGFFALGDLAVWLCPFLYGAGAVLRVAAGSSPPKLIAGAVAALIGVVLGAAYSADMSGLLLKLTRGGTVYMDAHPRRSYALEFAGCFGAVVLGALINGIITVYS